LIKGKASLRSNQVSENTVSLTCRKLLKIKRITRMKSRTKHRINPDSKSAILTVALTETKAKLIKKGARFCKVDLEEYVVSALSYRTVEILSEKKGFLESIRYRKLFFEALDGVDQKKRMLK
jgi:uncharacterized protein (DUF1778 family)